MDLISALDIIFSKKRIVFEYYMTRYHYFDSQKDKDITSNIKKINIQRISKVTCSQDIRPTLVQTWKLTV
jgi:hypothetical protein